MATIILRINERKEGAYPVGLHCDCAGPDWDKNPLVTDRAAQIPAILLPSPVAVPAAPQPGPGAAPEAREADAVENPQDRPDADSLRRVGEALADLILPGAVRAKWGELADRYPRWDGVEGRVGRRLILDIRPPELKVFPWELLYCPSKGVWVARNAGTPLSRAEGDIESTFRPSVTSGPLRVMIVVGSKEDDPAVKAELELQKVEETLWSLRQQVEYDEALLRPSREDLRARYLEFKPHVFHFIGHGRKLASGESCLVLYNPARPGDLGDNWLRDEIQADLSEHVPALVVLNACHTGLQDPQPEAWSLAQTFLDFGARCILGMRKAVPGAAAAHFAIALYRALTRGWDIDRAVNAARGDIGTLTTLGAAAGADWWSLATLHLRVPPDRVLPPSPPGMGHACERVRSSFPENFFFLNRTKVRWDVMETARSSQTRPGQLIVVVGREKVGKTSLLMYCCEACLARGFPVLHPRFEEGGTRDLLGALMEIRRTPVRWLGVKPTAAGPGTMQMFAEPPPAKAFDEFDARVTPLLGGKSVSYFIEDLAKQIPAFVPRRESDHDDLIADFRVGLDRLASSVRRDDPEAPPLVVLLDGLTTRRGGIESSHLCTYIMPMVGSIARKDKAGVLAILALSTAEAKQYLPAAKAEGAYTKLSIDVLNPPEFLALCWEFYRRKIIKDERWSSRKAENWKRLMKSWYEGPVGVRGFWEPCDLNTLEDYFMSSPPRGTDDPGERICR
jgi:hypothetical protein